MSDRKIACIGECLIELSRVDFAAGSARIGIAGDTFNTAVYLARLRARVSYLTNLGVDSHSDEMIRVMAREGLNTDLVGRHQTRLPGLYAIETDSAGERSFRYWRDTSAARTMFAGLGASFADLAAFDVIYLSGITLAILPPDVRADLIAAIAVQHSAGKTIVFDPNYRPRLWPDADTARRAFAEMWATTSLALPSYDDELLLYPGQSCDDVVARIAGFGVPEVVVKNGAAGPLIWAEGAFLRRAYPAKTGGVVDTSGAGDSFNAGYIAGRLRGDSPSVAAAFGHRLAGTVIGHSGAVIPREDMPI